MIEEYIQRPKDKLLDEFANDHWGITSILRVCDRRIGRRRLKKLKETTTDEMLLGVVRKRLRKK